MAALILLFAAFLVCELKAQDPAATLGGTVVDVSGAMVPRAKVEIRNTATNQVSSVESDAKGEFAVPNLPPGVYEVIVSKVGFRTLRETNLKLQLEQQARMEFRLELGAVAQTVEVQALAALLSHRRSRSALRIRRHARRQKGEIGEIASVSAALRPSARLPPLRL